MEIYTVRGQHKSDYDFSVTEYKLGCFDNKEAAIKRAKEDFESTKVEYAEEIEEYSNEDEYMDEDEGALVIEEDDENGYYSIAFGYEEDHETHVVCVETWELTTQN